MTYDYFYGQQAEMFAFYRVPKVLFTEDCFWNVSTDAKLLYGILLDRMNLSARNGWLDEEGRVYGMNYQKLGKDLATVDELAVLDGGKCILQLRGVRPFLSDKYDLTQHPNYKYTSDYDKKNEFNIEQFLSRRLKLKAGDEFVVVDAD